MLEFHNLPAQILVIELIIWSTVADRPCGHPALFIDPSLKLRRHATAAAFRCLNKIVAVIFFSLKNTFKESLIVTPF